MSYSPNRPEMKWMGDHISNFEERQSQPIAAIVQHCMGRNAAGDLATMAGTKSWFENPASKVSAHFGVGFDGTIWQFVPLTKAAWANGILQNPDVITLFWLAKAVRDKLNPNWLTISIEHEGDGIMPMPEPQYQASLALNRWLLALNGLKAGTNTIVRHSQITGRDRANCPGKSFPMVRLMKDLGAFGQMPNTFIDPVTGFKVPEDFGTFYKENGGLAIFGRPITGVETGAGLIPPAEYVQWFERARFEKRGQTIQLGLVGREAYRAAL